MRNVAAVSDALGQGQRAIGLSPTAVVGLVCALVGVLLELPSLALVGLIPIWTSVSRALFGTAISPMGLHGLIWFSTLALTALSLSPRYQSTWDVQTWVALVGSELCFAFGALLATSLRPVLRSNRTAAPDLPRLMLAMITIFTFGAVAFVVQVRAVGGPAALLADPMAVRERFMLRGFSYLYALLYLVPGIAILYRSNAKRFRGLALLLAIASVLMTAVTVSRFGLLMTLGIALLCLMLTVRDARVMRRKVLLVAAVAATAFVIIGQIRESIGAAGKSSRDRVLTGEVQVPISLAVLVLPYVYVAGGYENFDYQLRNAPTGAGGKYSLRALYGLVGGDGAIAQYTKDTGARLPFTKGNFLNTSIYLVDFLLDFGPLGIVAGPLVLGFAASLLFILRERAQVLTLANALVMYCLCMTFFSNYFTYLPVVFLIIVSVLIAMCTRAHRLAAGLGSSAT